MPVKILKKPLAIECKNCGHDHCHVLLDSSKGELYLCAVCYLPYTMPNIDSMAKMAVEDIEFDSPMSLMKSVMNVLQSVQGYKNPEPRKKRLRRRQ